MTSNELVLQQTKAPAPVPPSLLDMPPKLMAAAISDMASVLNDIIDKQEMFVKISGKKHVKVDGWCTLGTFLGVLPVEEEVKEEGRGWYAKVNLVNKNNGMVIGGASSICTRDENRWKDAPDYAVRSMAVTRATGKAYRLAFSWIMCMAGYNPTPYEEMPIEDQTIEAKPGSPRSDTTGKKASARKVIFDAKNQAFLDKLEKVLVERKTPPDQHLVIAEWLDGKEFSKENVEAAIDHFKPVEIPF